MSLELSVTYRQIKNEQLQFLLKTNNKTLRIRNSNMFSCLFSNINSSQSPLTQPNGLLNRFPLFKYLCEIFQLVGPKFAKK